MDMDEASISWRRLTNELIKFIKNYYESLSSPTNYSYFDIFLYQYNKYDITIYYCPCKSLFVITLNTLI
jgi:hypothetical protein